jgi:large subunit ribosomal protein L25
MSDQTTLRAETGRATGSRESRRIRRDGGVPAIIYGRGVEPINVTVDHHALMGIIRHSGSNAIITLEVGGDKHVTMPKVIERHPFRNMIRHVDFLKISLTETTTAEVTIQLVGEPVGVKEGGVLTHQVSSLTVSALPMNIPASIELNVEGLAMGDSLRMADLPVIDGVEYLADPDEMIAAVVAPRVAAEGEGEEGAEAEEGAAASGESEGSDEAADEAESSE